MDFSFTDEQELLLDNARRFVAERYGFAARKHILASADGYSAAVWKELADLGFLALNVPEADGGLGAGPVETMLVSMVVGEGLLVEPFLSSAVLATRTLATLGSAEQRARWLPKLAGGELIATLVLEAGYGRDGHDAIRAAGDAGGWELSGRVPVVYHAGIADLLLVAASTGATPGEPDAVFAVPAGAPGLHLASCTTVDGQVAADVELRGVRVEKSARVGGDARLGLAAVVDYGLFALCAEAIGALDRTLATTVEYTKTRNQFGGPIARFQALQHRMVDMLMRIEQARSLVYLAASRCDDADGEERERALSAAKVLVADAARFVGQQAVQLHGGMGVSDEVAISHYFKRLLAAEIRFGSSDAHLGRYERRLSAG
ncbi:MAG: acyl-CoA dehydrogenase family protein [Proteobacteria bacterium]|nr:acyl-CoA dehydrogenase family protein [Pseudomonadota bacterium]